MLLSIASSQVLWSTPVAIATSMPVRLVLKSFGELQLQDALNNVMWSSNSKAVGTPPHTLQVCGRAASGPPAGIVLVVRRGYNQPGCYCQHSACSIVDPAGQ
jgi:hypothetical protein